MPEHDALLQKLEELIIALPDRARFAPGATLESIAAAERSIGHTLPPSYRAFLRLHDGGFIARGPVADSQKAFEAERWNANHLRGCDDLVADYAEQFLIARDLEPALTAWPYLPFCHTADQELLMFGPPDDQGRQPVLDAFHEIGHEEWGVLAEDSSAYLEAYLEARGFPGSIAMPKG